jgi:hypothetical protein
VKAAHQLKSAKDAEAQKIAELCLDDTNILKAEDHIPKLISLMEENQTDVDLILGGFLVIRHFEDPSSFKSVWRERAGMKLLLQLLSSKEDQIRRQSVRFLGDTITKCGSQENSKLCHLGFLPNFSCQCCGFWTCRGCTFDCKITCRPRTT